MNKTSYDPERLQLLVKGYFDQNLTNPQMLQKLKTEGIIISDRCLRNCLNRDMGLYRRNPGIEVTTQLVKKELDDGVNINLGARRMRDTIQNMKGVAVRYQDVKNAMKYLDPIGVSNRIGRRLKRRVMYSAGPNDQWSFDGHDKLQKWNLYIHGCVDVFSGRMMWLNVNISNKNPNLICLYYLQAVREVGTFPFATRSDHGTESVELVSTQHLLHETHQTTVPNDKQHQYVTSTRNTKIESYWSRWLNSKGHAIRNILEHGEHYGRYNHNDGLHVQLFRYLWLPFIQRNLDEERYVINNSRRQKNKKAMLPAGVPNEMYKEPPSDYVQSGFPVEQKEIDALIEKYKVLTADLEQPEFVALCD